MLKGNNCHSETSASVDGASGILDPASRIFLSLLKHGTTGRDGCINLLKDGTGRA